MADIAMNRGDKLIFDNDESADTYMTQTDSGTTDILEQYVEDEQVRSVRIVGTSGNRAAIIKADSRSFVGIPLDQTKAAIQAAITQVDTNGGGVVRIPKGTYSIDGSIQLYSNIIVQGCGHATLLQATGTGLTVPFFLSQNESAALSKWGIRDLRIDNKDSTKGVGVRITKMQDGVLENVSIENVATGILVKDASYSNAIMSVSITEATTGVKLEGNSPYWPGWNRFFGVRVVGTTTGFHIDGFDNQFFCCAVEGRGSPSTWNFTNGIHIVNSAYNVGNKFYSPRLKNYTTSGTGILIEGASSQSLIMDAYFENLSTELSDTSTGKETLYLGQRPGNSSQNLSLGDRQIYTKNDKMYLRFADDSAYSNLFSGHIYLSGQAAVMGSGYTLLLRNYANSDYENLNCGKVMVQKDDVETLTKGTGLILNSTNYKWRIQVDDDGYIRTEQVT